jgi:small-conductance mechanosensitive channel
VNWNLKGLEAISVFAGTTLILLAVRWWILRGLDRAIGGPGSFPQVVRSYLKTPSLFWVLAAALELGLEVFELETKWQRLAQNTIVGCVILSVALVLNAMVQGWISRLPYAMAGLSRTLTRLFVFGVGLMILLRFWGVSITPVLTALGVGGLAVALALQDTLSNLFAGVHLLVEAPIAVGNHIRIGAGADDEGVVTDIGWRTTRIQTGGNSMVIVPNKTITSGTLINYDLPEPKVGASVAVLVGHNADILEVERICLEVAAATPGVLADAAPVLTADPGITATHLQFKLNFQVERQAAAGLVRAAIVKQMLVRFRAAGVPLPERTV